MEQIIFNLTVYGIASICIIALIIFALEDHR